MDLRGRRGGGGIGLLLDAQVNARPFCEAQRLERPECTLAEDGIDMADHDAILTNAGVRCIATTILHPRSSILDPRSLTPTPHAVFPCPSSHVPCPCILIVIVAPLQPTYYVVGPPTDRPRGRSAFDQRGKNMIGHTIRPLLA